MQLNFSQVREGVAFGHCTHAKVAAMTFFPQLLMGVLATGSMHTRPSAQAPIDASRKYWSS